MGDNAMLPLSTKIICVLIPKGRGHFIVRIFMSVDTNCNKKETKQFERRFYKQNS
jgi:hypothetical protein